MYYCEGMRPSFIRVFIFKKEKKKGGHKSIEWKKRHPNVCNKTEIIRDGNNNDDGGFIVQFSFILPVCFNNSRVVTNGEEGIGKISKITVRWRLVFRIFVEWSRLEIFFSPQMEVSSTVATASKIFKSQATNERAI